MTQEQNHGGKNDKRTTNPFLSLMLNPMLHAILELILWHKYEKIGKWNTKKPNSKKRSLSQNKIK